MNQTSKGRKSTTGRRLVVGGAGNTAGSERPGDWLGSEEGNWSGRMLPSTAANMYRPVCQVLLQPFLYIHPFKSVVTQWTKCYWQPNFTHEGSKIKK